MLIDIVLIDHLVLKENRAEEKKSDDQEYDYRNKMREDMLDEFYFFHSGSLESAK